jgi:hypothetical protein
VVWSSITRASENLNVGKNVLQSKPQPERLTFRHAFHGKKHSPRATGNSRKYHGGLTVQSQNTQYY